jgi:hypothetical protein
MKRNPALRDRWTFYEAVILNFRKIVPKKTAPRAPGLQ